MPDAEDDDEIENPDKLHPDYVEVVDPFAPEISFVKSVCPQHTVIRIVCDQLGK